MDSLKLNQRLTPLHFYPLAPNLIRDRQRLKMTAAWRCREDGLVDELQKAAQLSTAEAEQAQSLAVALVSQLRRQRAPLAQQLLSSFPLDTPEGRALMGLAEALLRIPDQAMVNRLLQEKLLATHWQASSTAGTVGRIMGGGLRLAGSFLQGYGKVCGPLIRPLATHAVRQLGNQFVGGESLEAALNRAQAQQSQGFQHSYDMLGEAALTEADAHTYLEAYTQAILAIGQRTGRAGPVQGAGISIKLSALSPRYQRHQYAQVMDKLYPRLLHLARLAKKHDLGLHIDAEESERLDLSIDLLERLCNERELQGWQGLGCVVQAYQKRSRCLVDYLIQLAEVSGHRLMVRLVKGAYWDTEIKRAQQEGHRHYPVYTHKACTDAAYLACARRLLETRHSVFPQFATHNAQTLASILAMAGPQFKLGDYEFQCLQGMGEPLYLSLFAQGIQRPCRIYVPVGPHQTLLPYLVRRLLENGANNAFVSQLNQRELPLEQLTQSPAEGLKMLKNDGIRHLPIPPELYGSQRPNSRGMDLDDDAVLAALAQSWQRLSRPDHLWKAYPVLGFDHPLTNPWQPCYSPGDPQQQVGWVQETSFAQLESALAAATQATSVLGATPLMQRTAWLQQAAALLERQRKELIVLLVQEAGKTVANAVAEVREAVDFLYYYATQAELALGDNSQPRGPIACISPWNFPLAIFIGQIAAALVTGNPVLAKPAEQTPLVAGLAVRLLHEAGIPREALQLLPGQGETLGAALVGDPRIQAVLFTGSLAVARQIQQHLAHNPHAPLLIAETGGLNAMLVDSTALPEQVVRDVLMSAFDSAGQRCSALRLLCIQEDLAPTLLPMLRGAMQTLSLGSPESVSTDIGPIIDSTSHNNILAYLQHIQEQGYPLFQPHLPAAHGCVPPTLIELPSPTALTQEVFGPVLHVVTYPREQLTALIEQINAMGYGLTMGLHTRLEQVQTLVSQQAQVGNLYINRNMVGATVGVQPFGGEGLSGTGPKAGGPLYLTRLLADSTAAARQACLNPATARQLQGPRLNPAAQRALTHWMQLLSDADSAVCRQFSDLSLSGLELELTGPTGELNTYRLWPRQRVLCLAQSHEDIKIQTSAGLAVGCTLLWPRNALTEALHQALPEATQERITLVKEALDPQHLLGGILLHSEEKERLALAVKLAKRPGPIVPLLYQPPGGTAYPLERLLVERAISLNTTAVGGNASLLCSGSD